MDDDLMFDEDILDQSIREGDDFLVEQEEKLRFVPCSCVSHLQQT